MAELTVWHMTQWWQGWNVQCTHPKWLGWVQLLPKWSTLHGFYDKEWAIWRIYLTTHWMYSLGLSSPENDELSIMMWIGGDGTWKTIHNYPIKTHDVTNAFKTFEPDLAETSRKMVWRKLVRVQPKYVQVPKEIIEQSKMMMLTADIIFVNQIPFILSWGQGIGWITVEWTPNTVKNSKQSI